MLTRLVILVQWSYFGIKEFDKSRSIPIHYQRHHALESFGSVIFSRRCLYYSCDLIFNTYIYSYLFQKLGFASCRRNTGATEGINVLIEKKTLDDKWAYGLSCIEYTEFDKFGIVNGPLSSNRFFATLGTFDIISIVNVLTFMSKFCILFLLPKCFYI